MLWGVAYGQSTIYIRGDSVRMEKSGGNSELILLNSTRAVTNGVLTNLGNGRTGFVIPGVTNVDTIYRTPGKDSIFFKIGSTTYAIKDSSGGAGLSDGDKVDITVSASGATWTIDNNVVSNAKFRQSAGLSVVGVTGNSTANVADITAPTDGFVLRRSGTTLGFGQIATAGITDGAVTYAKMQNVSATNRVIGRVVSSGPPEELTGTQITAMSDVFTTTLKGLVPPSGGTVGNFLRDDGTWTTSPGSGTVNSGNQYRIGYYAANGTAISAAAAITGSRALVSDANGVPTHATTTATELNYVNGVTSSIQSQLNSKADTNTLYILASGQSNINGLTGATSYDSAANQKVLGWSVSGGQWVVCHPGQDPLSQATPGVPRTAPDQYSTSSVYYVAKKLQARTGKTVKIFILGWDANSIDNWFGLTSTNFKFMDSVIRSAGSPLISYFLWDQGETDVGKLDTNYKRRYDSLLAQLDRQPYMAPKYSVYNITPSNKFNDERRPVSVLMALGSGLYGRRVTTIDASNFNLVDGLHFTARSQSDIADLIVEDIYNKSSDWRYPFFGSFSFTAFAANAPRIGVGYLAKDSTTKLLYEFDGTTWNLLAGGSAGSTKFGVSGEDFRASQERVFSGASTYRVYLDSTNLYARGVYGSGPTLYAVSAYTDAQMFFYPRKDAFRAGRDSTPSVWADANIGLHSGAIGRSPLASGFAAMAFGNGTNATGNESIAVNSFTIASGLNSFASGYNTTAAGTYSRSGGYQSIAYGSISDAFGNVTVTNNTLAFARGNQVRVDGVSAGAVGDQIKQKSYAGFAVGSYNDTATSSGSISAWSSTGRAFQVGIGLDNTTRANALTVLYSGNVGIGTVSPLNTLDINGDLRIRTLAVTSAVDSILVQDAGIIKYVDGSSFGGGGGGGVSQSVITDTLNNYWRRSGNTAIVGASTGSFLGTTNNISLRFRANNVERMVIDSVGEVNIYDSLNLTGIASVIPDTTVWKPLVIHSSGFVKKSNWAYAGTGGGGSGWGLTGNASTTAGTNYIGSSDNNSIDFRTNATPAMRLNTAQELLIGTTTDNGAYLLQVNGSILGSVFSLGASGANPKLAMNGSTIAAFVRTDNSDFAPVAGKYLNASTGIFSGSISTTPSALFHGIGTTEQARFGYDASNYISVTVGSTGSTSLNLTGTTPVLSIPDSLTLTAISAVIPDTTTWKPVVIHSANGNIKKSNWAYAGGGSMGVVSEINNGTYTVATASGAYVYNNSTTYKYSVILPGCFCKPDIVTDVICNIAVPDSALDCVPACISYLVFKYIPMNERPC